MERKAQCQCGSLLAITSGEPIRVSVCHCITCQQRTGSVFAANCYFEKSFVRIEGGAKSYARSAESGREVRNFFCPDCGTTLYWEADAAPDVYGMAVGAFKIPDCHRRHSPPGSNPSTVGSTCRMCNMIRKGAAQRRDDCSSDSPLACFAQIVW